jgi:hypothetical protein
MAQVEVTTRREHRTIHCPLADQRVAEVVEVGTPGGFTGTPPDAWVLDALRRPSRA